MQTFKTSLARKFDDAATQYLKVDASAVAADPMTLACFFNTDDLTINQDLMVVGVSGSISNRNCRILRCAGAIANDPVRASSGSNTGSSVSDSNGIVANQWMHAAGVFASTSSRIAYLNGVAGAEETTSRVITGTVNETDIGADVRSANTNYTSGCIAWPAIWNIALSQPEIERLAKGAHPTTVRPAALVAFWDFTGANTEFGKQGTYPLTNSGSVPINGPAFLNQRLPGLRRAVNIAATGGSPLVGGGVGSDAYIIGA